MSAEQLPTQAAFLRVMLRDVVSRAIYERIEQAEREAADRFPAWPF